MGGRFAIVNIIVAVIVSTCLCIPVPKQGHQDVVVTLLGETWSSDHRVRRAADSNLPDTLEFSVVAKEAVAVLRMRRSRMLPVVMSDEEKTRAASGFSEDAAVYTDLSLTSAMIVKRDAHDYALKGSFVHNDVLWNLDHTNEGGKESRICHRITPQVASETTSYVGDEIEFNGDTTNDTVTETGQGIAQQNIAKQAPNNDNYGRVRRETMEHVVRVAFVVDFADYSKWVRYFGVENAPREMRLWYSYLAQSVNVRYRTIKDPDVAIRVDVTVLKILDDAKDASFLTKITNEAGQFNGEKGLSSFVKWHQRQRNLPASHHYMLFTGLDIAGIAGIAYVGRLCKDEGISIVENTFDGNAGNTAAHELGHSLSAKHDEETKKGSECTYDDQYIMASAFKRPVKSGTEGHPWRFSSCSIEAFKEFLSRTTCTHKTDAGRDVLSSGDATLRPGEELSKDEQCRYFFQNRLSYYCQDTQESQRGVEQLCGGMFCSVPDSENVCRPVIPQEFTECGTGKVRSAICSC
ncbi:hypothetical protein BsWGS_24366 [Bradybaena similaris]